MRRQGSPREPRFGEERVQGLGGHAVSGRVEVGVRIVEKAPIRLKFRTSSEPGKQVEKENLPLAGPLTEDPLRPVEIQLAVRQLQGALEFRQLPRIHLIAAWYRVVQYKMILKGGSVSNTR